MVKGGLTGSPHFYSASKRTALIHDKYYLGLPQAWRLIIEGKKFYGSK